MTRSQAGRAELSARWLPAADSRPPPESRLCLPCLLTLVPSLFLQPPVRPGKCMQPRRERVIPARRVRIAEKWSAFKKCLPTFLGGAFGVGGHAAAWAIFVPAIRSAGLPLFAAERIARLSFKPADFIEETESAGQCAATGVSSVLAVHARWLSRSVAALLPVRSYAFIVEIP